MTDDFAAGTPDADFAQLPGGAGAALRAARESAGLSIETIAQHLKLAPRQVKALEEGDYAQLPERTFVRGFARNYARLMQLDPEAIVAALPEALAAPAPDRPQLGSSTRPIGELPDSQQGQRRTWLRWAIPFALIVVIGGAAVYQFTRPQDSALPPETRGAIQRSTLIDPIGPVGGGVGGVGGNGVTPLPNPLTGGDSPASSVGSDASKDLVSGTRASGDPLAISQSAPPATASLPVSTAEPAPRSSGSTVSTTAGAAAESATLVINYRANAWTEVRDGSGERLLVVTGAPGSTQKVSGAPPFDLILGNASQTSVTWRGAAFDLAPYVRGNIARARLP